MLKESQMMFENIERYFTRKSGYSYKVLIVENELFDYYSIFFDVRGPFDKSIMSYPIINFDRDKRLYDSILHDLKARYKFSIEYRLHESAK